MNFSVLILIVLLVVIFPKIYHIGQDNSEEFFFNKVFGQSQEKNKNFENGTLITSDETKTQNSNQNTHKFNVNHTKTNTSSNTTSTGNILDDLEEFNFTQSNNVLPSENTTWDKTPIIKKPLKIIYPKVHPAINHILENSNPKAIAYQYGASIDKDKLVVYVYLTDNHIIPRNIEILAQHNNIIQSKLNLNQILSLANSTNVEKITLPDLAVFYDHITSEGVEFSRADLIHSSGINGTGIKVGIIDDSFYIDNPEISGNIKNTMFGDGCDFANLTCWDKTVNPITPINSHGTAVAEIVVDMAPGVDLWVYAVKDSLDFSDAVQHAIDNDLDIITASLGFPNLWGDVWYRDGTSYVARWVDWANGNGTLFTVAVGNLGDKHWSGDYNSTTKILVSDLDDISPGTPTEFKFEMQTFFGINSVLSFNSSATGNMRACLPITDSLQQYFVRWNDSIGTDQDYDVFIYDSTLNDFKNAGASPQNGGTFDLPMENFTSSLPAGPVCLVIGSSNSTENHKFHIETSNMLNIPDDDFHRLGSVDTPADAVGALSVGAINFNNTPTNYSDDVLELFSSRGPTDDGRLKPEICGPDRTATDQTTLTGGTNKFTGTSAATPQIAGAAALLLEDDPTLTVSELKQKLIDNARFDADFSVDNKCGSNSGSLQLLTPTVFCTPPESGPWAITESCMLNNNYTGEENVTVQNNSVLTIPDGITLTVDFYNFNLTVKSGSGILIKPGGTINSLPPSDSDGDGVPDGSDNCPLITNSNQLDTDEDSIGDACDIDDDNDTVLDVSDNCPLIANVNQNDLDSDSTGDACDSNTIITSNTTLTSDTLLGGDLVVESGFVLTVNSDVIMDFDFANQKILVKSGGGILIKPGGAIR